MQGYIQIIMASAVTLAAILLHYVIFTDVIAAFPTTEHEERDLPVIDLPPVLFSQTPGALYIKDPRQYYTLWCNGSEGARVTWTYNGQNISDPDILELVEKQEGVQFTFPDPNAVLLYDRQEKIHGYLQCFVTNNYGSTFGDKVFVTHAVLNWTEEGQRSTTLVSSVGDTVTLSCDDHIQDLPTAHIRWYKDSKTQEIDPDRRQGFFCNSEKSVCVISHAKRSDEGKYICTFTIRGKPKSISKVFDVVVNEPSDYDPYSLHPLNLIDHVSSPCTIEAQPGDNVQLRCAFRGTRGGDIQWTRGETNTDCSIQERNILSNGTSSKYMVSKNGTYLNIHNFTVDDEGFYLCSADNDFDRYTHRIRLKVVMSPILSDKILGVETHLSGTVRLNCSVTEAIPEAETTWWVNTEVVREDGLGKYRLDDGGATLVLYNASLDDTSSVTCNVSNKVGSMLGHRYIAVRNITKTQPEADQEVTDSIQTSIGVIDTTPAPTDGGGVSDVEQTSETPSTEVSSLHEDPAVLSDANPADDDTTFGKVASSQQNVHTEAKYEVQPDDDDGSHSAEIDVGSDDKSAVSDPTYFVKEHGERKAEANPRIGADHSKPWQQSAWPWILITLCVFVLGLAIGIFSTRYYLLRHKQEHPIQERHNVIENSPSVLAYRKCRSPSPETESMMRGTIQMETVVT